jgi:hypothetical protein
LIDVSIQHRPTNAAATAHMKREQQADYQSVASQIQVNSMNHSGVHQIRPMTSPNY